MSVEVKQPTLDEDRALLAKVEAAGGLKYGNTMRVLRKLGIRYADFNKATNRVMAHDSRVMGQ
jgi:hypothetical protein